MHLIWGAEVDPALRPVLLVTLMGSLAGSSAWNFMGIWAVKELGATSTQLSYGYLLMAAVGGVVGYARGAPLRPLRPTPRDPDRRRGCSPSTCCCS